MTTRDGWFAASASDPSHTCIVSGTCKERAVDARVSMCALCSLVLVLVLVLMLLLQLRLCAVIDRASVLHHIDDGSAALRLLVAWRGSC